MNRSEQTGFLSQPSSVTRDDKCWALYRDIICLISAPELLGQSAWFYGPAAQDEVPIKENLPECI